MQLMKNYSHGNTNDMIFKVAFVANGQLVSGGKGGCARIYDVQSGQLLQTLEHDEGELMPLVCIPRLMFSSPRSLPDGRIVQAVEVRCYAVLVLQYFILINHTRVVALQIQLWW